VRRRIAWLALAITLLIVVAFTVPLMLLVRQQATDRAQINAEHAAETVAGLVALSAPEVETLTAAGLESAIGDPPENVRLVLPDGSRLGEGPTEYSAIEDSARAGDPAAGYIRDGHWEVGIPVQTSRGIIAVIASATVAELHQGVATAWIVLGTLGLVVVAAAVGVAIRLGRELVRPVGELAAVADRLGEGDLSARARGDGPPELAAVASALNGLAERLGDLIKAERESLADLSHRLRTPLTSLRLQSEGLHDPEERDLLTGAVDRMQEAVDGMIIEVRQGRTAAPAVDFSQVVSKRMVFWTVLAEEQERAVIQIVTDEPLMVRADNEDLGSVLDALIGNVLAYTPPGTAFEVRLTENDGRAVLTIGDAGPGFPPGSDPTKRGVSGAGSTGLGLDIARKLAERTGGSIRLGRSPLGGAQVELQLGLSTE
jgi:signal transduction histidine kinase